ncbi:MAG: SDR family NAD(P)-dependent oxidoreductase [Myxococcota bacterium]
MSARYEGDAFRERFGRWAVIAGGSDGIGGAFAREAAARGLDVALIARRADPLAALAESLEGEFGVATRPIQADLTRDDIVEVVAAATDDLDVGLFVHNAGSNPEAGGFLDQPIDHALFLVSLSCRAPIALGHHFGARLRARGRGGMIFMSSMACLAGSGNQAAYAATKAFDTILAEGLWVELAPHGVDVLGVLAGATRTETMLEQKPDVFADAMPPGEVARGALDHLGKGPEWIPGAENQAMARGLWPVPRVGVINAMTAASAGLFALPNTPVAGIEFDEGD